MNDLISVIVPIYNVEEYLEECIDSIVNQTYKNLEIILVDDGATDSCPKICEKWAERDNRIRVVHKTNGGLSDARNAGLAVATGQYIGYVDSDDYIAYDMYELLHKAIVENDSLISVCQFTDVCDGKIQKMEESGKTIVFTGENFVEQILSNRPSPRLSNSVWKFLYRVDVAKSILFEKGRYYEDALYTMPICIKLEKVVFVDRVLYYYRQRKSSIMGVKITSKHVEDMLHYQEGLRRLVEYNGNESLVLAQRHNQSKMILEYRYLCCDDENMSLDYQRLSNIIRGLKVIRSDVPSYSLVKYILYRYLPKLLIKVKHI